MSVSRQEIEEAVGKMPVMELVRSSRNSRQNGAFPPLLRLRLLLLAAALPPQPPKSRPSSP